MGKESDGVEESKQRIHNKVRKLQTLTMGSGMGSDGGRACGGGGRGSDDDGTHAYYQNMIEANPNNALFLGNYAKFLKEVIGFI